VTGDAYNRLVQSVLELGYVYASLDPQGGSVGVQGDFLAELWQQQGVEGDLAASGSALSELLAGVQDPVKAISFINHLLQAATDVATLEEITQRVRQEVRETIALNMLRKHLPLETIADVIGLTIAQLQQLQASQPPKDCVAAT